MGAAIGFVYAMIPGVAGSAIEKRIPIPEAVEENNRRRALYAGETVEIPFSQPWKTSVFVDYQLLIPCSTLTYLILWPKNRYLSLLMY